VCTVLKPPSDHCYAHVVGIIFSARLRADGMLQVEAALTYIHMLSLDRGIASKRCSTNPHNLCIMR